MATGPLSNKKPAPSAAEAGSAASGLRKRPQASAKHANANTGRGLKIGPTTVLVLCLVFVGLVVLLHVWGKFRG